MRRSAVNDRARKKPVNLSIDGDLLQQAKALDINLSQALEQRLVELLQAARRQQWREQNRGAVEDYNRHIERDGVFGDGLRRF